MIWSRSLKAEELDASPRLVIAIELASRDAVYPRSGTLTAAGNTDQIRANRALELPIGTRSSCAGSGIISGSTVVLDVTDRTLAISRVDQVKGLLAGRESSRVR
jgi:hypothetical protein